MNSLFYVKLKTSWGMIQNMIQNYLLNARHLAGKSNTMKNKLRFQEKWESMNNWFTLQHAIYNAQREFWKLKKVFLKQLLRVAPSTAKKKTISFLSALQTSQMHNLTLCDEAKRIGLNLLIAWWKYEFLQQQQQQLYLSLIFVYIELHSGTVYFRWSEDIFVHMMYQCYIIALLAMLLSVCGR